MDKRRRKFTVEQVRQIRSSLCTCRKLAEAYSEEFGRSVSQVAIWKIRARHTYKWVPDA
jgi:hypothetical protein